MRITRGSAIFGRALSPPTRETERFGLRFLIDIAQMGKSKTIVVLLLTGPLYAHMADGLNCHAGQKGRASRVPAQLSFRDCMRWVRQVLAGSRIHSSQNVDHFDVEESVWVEKD